MLSAERVYGGNWTWAPAPVADRFDGREPVLVSGEDPLSEFVSLTGFG